MGGRDHPRSRGVYTELLIWDHSGTWIIPARAGFTRRLSRRGGRRFGSSPLARGLLLNLGCRRCDTRIIPARAGFTSGPRWSRSQETDHPRSRGVYLRKFFTYPYMMGSSPLARGLRAVDVHVVRVVGIIPARAGFTRHRCHLHRPASDHPRSRGVYCAKYGFMIDTEGSSPLARGLQPSEIVLTVPQGIIPARAGFTTRSV